MFEQKLTKQNLKAKTEHYIYTCSSDEQFMKFIDKNAGTIKNFILKNNLYEKREHENLSQKEMVKLNVDRYIHALKLSQQTNQPNNIYRRADYLFHLIGITLNTAAFLNTIQLLGTQQQGEKWRNLILSGKSFGGYGQTQLGHGSNVQGLETQAHYDQKKQVFRINSPTVTSAKFWPGVLGQVCTHSVIQARTFVKGKPIGIQTFIFEVRDENLKTIKGVKAGDIGPKFGFHRVDNGYLLVNNVQIPRDWMLMKYIQVMPDGTVKGQENKQAVKYAYGSMLYLRVALPFSFAFGHIIFPSKNLNKIYKQMGRQNDPHNRKKIIEYLSVGNGIVLANMYAKKLFNNFAAQLNAKNFQKADKALVKCHILSATFKALTSWKALKIASQIATINKFCVFRTSGIPYSFNNIVPSVTYEGDNSVLLQQTARFILMKEKDEQLSKPALNVKDDQLPAIITMLKYVSSMEIRRLKKLFQKQFQAGLGMKTVWNQIYQRDIIQVSKLWGVLQLISGFNDTLQGLTDLKHFYTKIGKVFTKNLLQDVPQIYTYGFVLQQSESWKLLTDEQFWVLTNIQRPIDVVNESHQLIERKGDWIRSKL